MANINAALTRVERQKVYDPDTMTWVAMTQPGGGGGGDVHVTNMIPAVETGLAKDVTLLAVETAAEAIQAAVEGTLDVSVAGTVSVSIAGSVPVTGPLTDAELRASAVPISGTVTASGPLTDTQLRASVVPVDGSGVTQPISAVALPLPSGAATGTKQDTGNTSLASIDTKLTSPLTVTGALTDTQLRASAVPISVATLPNSSNLDVALSTRLKAADTLAGVTTVGTITNPVTVTPPTLTKGTQGSTGFSTQDLKDSGRTAVIFYATGVASGTTGSETAISLTKSSGTGATSSATSFVVTSGKRFRITTIIAAARGHATATVEITTFSLRLNTGGAVTTSSTPVLLSLRAATPATSLAWDRVLLEIPEGYEILGDGTLQIGVTANAVFTTNAPTWDFAIVGYEY